jgi:integrase
MTHQRLTDLKLRNLEPQATAYGDGGGLWFRVRQAGHADGFFRYATTDAERKANSKLGKERWMPLGAYPDTSLAEFRDLATEGRRLRRQGMDPLNVRASQRAAAVAAAAKTTMTFDVCGAGYVAGHERAWGAAHRGDWTGSMRTYASPVLGSLPVAMVDTPLVLKTLRPIWEAKHITAVRVQQRIEAVLDWATTQHYREGPNPARWKGLLEHALPSTAEIHVTKSHAALPYQGVASLVAELQARDDRDALCLQLLILTAVRVDAATGARREEFDLTKKIWTIPASRMKRRGKRKAIGFRVPLSESAIAAVERTGIDGGLLFPRASDKSMAAAHGREDITTHGFRSSFRDWCGEQTTFAREVVEMAMSHACADATEAAYFRSDLLDRRRPLMSAWAEFCLTPWSEPKDGANVVELRRA